MDLFCGRHVHGDQRYLCYGSGIFDTYLYWSGFGQLIILLLIQTGGLGLMTCIAMIACFCTKKLLWVERRLLMQSAGSMQISGIVKLIKRIHFMYRNV
jgi:trk system potassium uptake protein TrkH